MSYIFIPEIGQKEPVWLEDEIPEDAVKSWPSLGMTGLTHSIETKQKLSNAHKTRTSYAKGWKMEKTAKNEIGKKQKIFADSLTKEERSKHYLHSSQFLINNGQTECPKCGKQGQYRAMKRWHFENCRIG